MSVTKQEAEQRISKCFGKNLTHQQNQKLYDEWSMTYDEDHDVLQGQGPQILAQAVANIYPMNRENIIILDVAAGTGTVGEELYKQGFKIIDVLEPNENMLKIARKKNIHRKEFMEAVIGDEKTSIASDSYDVVTCRGGFGSGALPVNSILEMLRMTKPGGHVVIVTRPYYFESIPEYVNKIRPLMKTLEDSNKWIKIREEIIPNIFASKSCDEGVVFVYKKL